MERLTYLSLDGTTSGAFGTLLSAYERIEQEVIQAALARNHKRFHKLQAVLSRLDSRITPAYTLHLNAAEEEPRERSPKHADWLKYQRRACSRPDQTRSRRAKQRSMERRARR